MYSKFRKVFREVCRCRLGNVCREVCSCRLGKVCKEVCICRLGKVCREVCGATQPRSCRGVGARWEVVHTEPIFDRNDGKVEGVMRYFYDDWQVPQP